MSSGGVRVPHVAGVAGGVGTSVVAAALRATDRGVYHNGPIDILVCQTTASSLELAQHAIQRAPRPPVLVVVDGAPIRVPRSVRAEVRMVSPYVEAVVPVPFLMELRELADPYTAVATALRPDIEQSRVMQAFVAAMRRTVAAVTPLLTNVSAHLPLAHPEQHPNPGLVRAPRRPRWPIAH